MGIETVAIIIALILSIVLHEVAHGYAANWLGDPTARLAGRFSPNPLVHLDPLGSVIIPGLLVLSSSGLLLGWAKPVPYNPYNLNNQRWGELIVAAAGPLTNILLALIFAALLRFGLISGAGAALGEVIVYLNILLALFNLIPIPPLDGSKVLVGLLPVHMQMQYQKFAVYIERLGIIGMFLLIFLLISVFGDIFFGFVSTLTGLLIGW